MGGGYVYTCACKLLVQIQRLGGGATSGVVGVLRPPHFHDILVTGFSDSRAQCHTMLSVVLLKLSHMRVQSIKQTLKCSSVRRICPGFVTCPTPLT